MAHLNAFLQRKIFFTCKSSILAFQSTLTDVVSMLRSAEQIVDPIKGPLLRAMLIVLFRRVDQLNV